MVRSMNKFCLVTGKGTGRTVKTANATVPMMKLSELLYLSNHGGLEPCCVKDANQVGRAISVFV